MDIDKDGKEKIRKLAIKRDLKFVILYGSRAKNIQNIDSDIDIAVLGNKEIIFDDIIELNNEFSDIFQVKEIDVKSLHNVGPLFRYQVMSSSILLYGSMHDYNSFRAYAFRDYCDSKSLFDLKLKIINLRIKDLKKINA